MNGPRSQPPRRFVGRTSRDARRRSLVGGSAVAVVLCLLAWRFPSEWHAALQGGVPDRLVGWSGVDLFRLGLCALAAYAFAVAAAWPRSGESRPGAVRRADPGRLSRRSARRWLLGITLAGALIRLWGLGGSFWLDELYTRRMAVENSWLENLTTFATTNNHIAHTLLTTMWTSLFGDQEWVVRITAFGFGVAGIWAVYGLTRRVASREASVWASALCAVTYHHVMFSQNARGYTAQLFFFTMACGFLHAAVRGGRTSDWVRFVLTSWVSLWFVFLSGFAFVAHGLVALTCLGAQLLRGIGSRAQVGRAMFAFFGLALLSFQSYALMLPSIVRVLQRDYGNDGGGGLHILSRNFLRDLAAGFGLTLPQALVGGGLLCAVGAWLGVGVLRRYPLMLALLVGPSLVVVAFALQTGLDVYPRFFLTLMIGFFVVLAELGTRIGTNASGPRSAARHPLWLGWPLVPVLVLFAVLLPRVLGTPKQPYREGLEWAWAHLEGMPPGSNDPRILCLGHASTGCDFYAPRVGLPPGASTGRPAVTELQRARTVQPSGVLAVTTLQRLSARAWPDVFEELRANWRPVRRFRGTIGDGDVVVWEPRPPPRTEVGGDD